MTNARHDNTLPLGPLMRWVVLVFLAGLLGLCFVHMKHKLKVDGDRCRDLEQAVADLNEKIKVADNEVMRLTSRPALERRRVEGFIRMVEVQPNRMVRLRMPETQSASLAAGKEVAP